MSGAVQTGYAPPPDPDEPARGRRWLPWLVAVSVLWAVLLTALTWLSVRDDGPTVREQRTLSEAGPVVDRAVGDLVAAAGDGAAPELVPPRVERGCRLTPFLDGATLERAVLVRVPEDEVESLLRRIADRLPADYRSGVRLTDEGLRLRADAGEFVAVEGAPLAGGGVTLTVDTGCRPVGDGYTAPPATGAQAEVDAAAGALRTLGRPAAGEPELVSAPCPDGGRDARTARLTAGPGTPPPSLAAALAPLAAGAVVLDTPEVYAFRRGPVTVVAETAGDRLRVSASTGCAG